MATIRQTRTGKWQAQVYLGKNAQTGRPEFRTKTKDTKAQAAAWARQAEVDRDEGAVASKAQAEAADGRLTVGDYWRDVVLPARRVTTAKATVDRNVSHWANHLDHAFGHRPLAAVRRAEVKRWVTARVAGTDDRPQAGVPTVQASLHLLSAIYAHAIDDELLDDNPCTGVRTPKHEAADKGYLSRDEVMAVLGSTPEPYRLFLELTTMTGLRFGEAAGLTPEFILANGAQVKVRKVWARPGVLKDLPKNSSSRRVVPVPRALRARLAAVALKTTPGAPVFKGAHGGNLSDSNVRRVLLASCERAKVRPVTPHMLRHAYTSWLTEAGVAAKDVAEVLGHASTRMLDRYAHLAPGHGERILEALEGGTKTTQRAG